MGAIDFNELLSTTRALSQSHSQTAEFAALIFNAHKHLPLLDLACGNGRDTLYFCEQGFQITGVDLAENTITRLRNSTSLDFRTADACQLPFPGNYFGTVYNFGLMHVFTEQRVAQRQKVMSEIKRVLKPGGLALLNILWTDQPGCGLPEICCLTEQEVDDLYAGFFLLEKAVIHDSSCTGWVGKYWRLLLEKSSNDLSV